MTKIGGCIAWLHEHVCDHLAMVTTLFLCMWVSYSNMKGLLYLYDSLPDRWQPESESETTTF
jgi:hypothetical protein